MGDADFSNPSGGPSGPAANDTGTIDAPGGQQSPEEALAAAQAEIARLKEDWLRAQAEMENVRRRAQEDVTKAHKFGVETFATSLLGAKDALDAALAVATPTLDSLREGTELTARLLDSVFERNSLVKIAPAPGEKFDPHRHQAISQVESAQEPNTVVSVLQGGYRLHERVLRPALVTVARAPEA